MKGSTRKENHRSMFLKIISTEICKNISECNSAVYKNTYYDQVGPSIGIQGWFNILNQWTQSTLLKDWRRDVIPIHAGKKKNDKFQHLFVTKTHKSCLENNFLNLQKNIKKIPTTNIMLNGERTLFPHYWE